MRNFVLLLSVLIFISCDTDNVKQPNNEQEKIAPWIEDQWLSNLDKNIISGYSDQNNSIVLGSHFYSSIAKTNGNNLADDNYIGEDGSYTIDFENLFQASSFNKYAISDKYFCLGNDYSFCFFNHYNVFQAGSLWAVLPFDEISDRFSFIPRTVSKGSSFCSINGDHVLIPFVNGGAVDDGISLLLLTLDIEESDKFPGFKAVITEKKKLNHLPAGWINSQIIMGDEFLVSTYSGLFSVDKMGDMTKISEEDYHTLFYSEENDLLYAVRSEMGVLEISKDKGNTWEGGWRIALPYHHVFYEIDNQLVSVADNWIIWFDFTEGDKLRFMELNNEGLRGEQIKDITEANDSIVQVITDEGVYNKKKSEFFKLKPGGMQYEYSLFKE
nr:hypothetical protein [uncultured Carboxylicivirga sp.]